MTHTQAAVQTKDKHRSVNAFGVIAHIVMVKVQLFMTPMLQHLEWTIL